ncbi:hypothetical protein CPB85DRAFT_1154249, partial [Mucidula mucida]
LSALCLHLNVQKMSPAFASPADMPAVLDVPVLHDARMPTHILVLFSTNAQRVADPPLLVPVDSDLYNHGFRSDLIPPSAPGTTRPVPYPSSQGLYVSIPAVHPLTTVPHPTSFPLLLLFALGLEPNANDLAYQMLPTCVVEEFPNAAAMAQVMAASVGEDEFERRFRLNMGLWKNVLGLGVRDSRIVEMIRTAWNVT